MIVKERDSRNLAEDNRIGIAGAKAEAQMAHYLKRAFGNNPTIFVFNDLRIADQNNDEYAQMDHLVLYQGGLIIVESKSVTTAVRINKLQEWSRQWNGNWGGMPSPIQQAKRQSDLLRELLQTHRSDLRAKILFGKVQKGFRALSIDVLIAISDQGTIQREVDVPEVLKADQVTDRISALVEKISIGFLSWALKDNDEEPWGSLEDGQIAFQMYKNLSDRLSPLYQ